MEEDLRENSHGKDLKKRCLHAGNDAINQELGGRGAGISARGEGKRVSCFKCQLKGESPSFGKGYRVCEAG